MSEYKPPTHELLKVSDGRILLHNTFGLEMAVSHQEAISLGLALMETGLHLKALAKPNPPTTGEEK